MFSILFYKVVHLVGLFVAFMGLAGLVWAALTNADKASKRPALIFHGVGLFFALVGGFGLAARLGLVSGLPGWIHAKIACWVLIGMLPIVVKRKPELAYFVWFTGPLLGLLAAYLGVYKPF